MAITKIPQLALLYNTKPSQSTMFTSGTGYCNGPRSETISKAHLCYMEFYFTLADKSKLCYFKC